MNLLCNPFEVSPISPVSLEPASNSDATEIPTAHTLTSFQPEAFQPEATTRLLRGVVGSACCVQTSLSRMSISTAGTLFRTMGDVASWFEQPRLFAGCTRYAGR